MPTLCCNCGIRYVSIGKDGRYQSYCRWYAAIIMDEQINESKNTPEALRARIAELEAQAARDGAALAERDATIAGQAGRIATWIEVDRAWRLWKTWLTNNVPLDQCAKVLDKVDRLRGEALGTSKPEGAL